MTRQEYRYGDEGQTIRAAIFDAETRCDWDAVREAEGRLADGSGVGEMTAAEKAAATRRIRRRAAQWRVHREAARQTIDAYAKRFRELAEGNRFLPELCPPHSAEQLREVYERTIADRRKAIHGHMRERNRLPHMRRYYREQIIKGLAGLRDAETARQALEIVCAELAQP